MIPKKKSPPVCETLPRHRCSGCGYWVTDATQPLCLTCTQTAIPQETVLREPLMPQCPAAGVFSADDGSDSTGDPLLAGPGAQDAPWREPGGYIQYPAGPGAQDVPLEVHETERAGYCDSDEVTAPAALAPPPDVAPPRAAARPPRLCAYGLCGAPFVSKKAIQRYCSVRCSALDRTHQAGAQRQLREAPMAWRQRDLSRAFVALVHKQCVHMEALCLALEHQRSQMQELLARRRQQHAALAHYLALEEGIDAGGDAHDH